MRVLVIGAGGVGSAVVPIAARRDFFERLVVADYDAGRARAGDRQGRRRRAVRGRTGGRVATGRYRGAVP